MIILIFGYRFWVISLRKIKLNFEIELVIELEFVLLRRNFAL